VGRESLSRLSTLILGGDAVLPGDVNLADSNTTIINAYGPAECTPTSTFAQVTPDSFGIGYGAGVCTWVVDDNGSLASVGSIGELWLEGPLVGEGYLNDPKKTAATFVENPPWLLRGVLERPALQARPGRHGRLYRTGDLVQQKEDGSLVFVGRKDTQVKIRGQRVELGDVEQHIVEALRDASSAASLDVAQVQAIAEMIQPDWANSAILVAFISLEYSGNKNMTEESHTLAVHQTTDALADRLKDKVPTYMVPMAFIPIFKLPTTTTGKIDRKRLRTIGGSVYMPHRKSPGRKEQKESLSELEAILQQVWMSVLNLSSEDASIDAAFMRLGGDSISAMQVVSRGRLHNLEFTIGDLLKAGTIRKLAARCQIISQDAKQESEEHIQDDRDTGEWFEISPIQQSFFDIYPNGLNHFNQTFVLELSKAVPTAILSNAYHTLVRRHSMLRARFNKNHDSGLWMQRAAQEDDMQSFAFTEHFVEHRGDFARAAQLRQESLDIEHGPVFAFDLFIIPDGSQILVLSSHHLVIDLVSWRIIWNDIEEFIAHGKLLSQPTTSFQRWCRRQAKIGHNLSPLSVLPYSIPEPQLSFWGLPVRDNTFANRQFYTEIFEEDVSKPLFGVCNEILKTEPVDIILGAMVYSFLHTFPERTVPVIWIEGHGREQSHDMPHDVSGTVGWFTTIYPLDIPITLESTVFDAVRLAKDTKRKIPGNGRPFFACRYHSESGRDAFQGHDVVEVTFNFTGRYQQLEREEGLFTRSDSLREVESAIVDVSGSAQRFTMIEITADVDEGLLDVTFQVHKAMKHQDRLREWTEAFYETLESLTEALLRSTPSFTLSDLPLLPLSYSGLDTLLKKQLPSMGIRTDAVSDIYPVSPLQEGMLLSSQKGTSSYATVSIWQCVPSDTSAISPSRLEAAWRTVVGRHTILQTVFSLHPEGNGFIQLVVPGSKIRVVHMTVEEDNPTVILSRLETPTFAANEPEHAFTICQSTMGEVACRLDASHSLVDASSMTIIVSDIISVYDCCDLAPAPLFSEMIRHINSGPKAQRISSWTKLLDGVEPCEFPTSSLRPEQAASESHSDVAIPANLTTGITQFCKKLCITRAVFLQVAWAMTLSQVTGHGEVIFGYLASGRDSPVSGIESIVGPLANMLVSRIDLRLPAKQVLKITSEKSMEHLTLQHVSLAEIQHQLGLGGQRLFNTSLSVQEVEKFTSTEKRSLSFESQDGEDPHEVCFGTSRLYAL
jgi:non-ribosomal peptide synthase protein (TIGR01720 family)